MTGGRRSSWSPGGWVPPALGDLNRLVVSVESGLHADCDMRVSFNTDDELLLNWSHLCGLLPEVVPMTGGENHD